MLEDDAIVLESSYVTVPRERVVEKAYALLASANSSVPPERRVDVFDIKQLLDRLAVDTATLVANSALRSFRITRAVNDFLQVATKGSEPKFCQNYLDLLPVGHPFSTRDPLSLTASAVNELRVRWISGDPNISAEARPLVASAFKSEPGSIEREFLVARLEALPASQVPRKVIISLLDEG
jgi:hypothetical protein